MPNNWKTYKLGELYKSASGLSKSSKEFGFGNPFVTFKNVFYNYFLPNELDSLVNTNEKEINSCSVKKGDVFLTRTSETLNELGMSSVALKDYPTATFNGFCKRLRLLDNSPINIDPVFFGFYLRSNIFRNEVTKLASITTRASLNNDAIYSITLTLPDFDEQVEIGNILKSINDKIENNLAINKNLEEMAMALYKHWFVDFGPFKNGKFVESELGLIPEGWEVKSLGDLYDTTSGGTPSRAKMEYYENGTIQWIKSKELGNTFIIDTEEKITDVALSKSSAKRFPAKSVLIAMYGATVGEIAINSEIASCNQAICAIKQIDLPYHYVFLFLKSEKENILNQAVGSAQQNISQIIIKNLKLLNPSIEDVKYLFTELDAIFNKLESNIKENQTLTQLRDTILPKLISGEVRLKEFREKMDAVQVYEK